MNKKNFKKLLNTLGKALGIVALIFVLYTLSQEYTLSTFITKLSSVTSLLPVLFLLNTLSILLGIYAWDFMLRNYSSEKFPFTLSYYYFGKTEIAKYLPGNIFHIIGRQALASKVGISQAQMGKISLLWSLLLLAATLFSSTFFALLSQGIANYILLLMILSSFISIFTMFFVYQSFSLHDKIKLNFLLTLSLIFQGIMITSIIFYQQDYFDYTLFFQCTSIYIISWLIGFVTPGASGGLGVREGTFIAIVNFLHLPIASEIIVFSVLLVRLINILTDVLLYLSTFMFESKINTLSSKG